MLPRSGVRKPSIHSMGVVLPAPLGPIKPKTSPWCTSKGHVGHGYSRAVGCELRKLE
jgi:hypothetical protein